MTIKKVTQVVDGKGRLKNKKCPKCGEDAMYFNFHNILICRNCSYTPSCPTCKRLYCSNDRFKGEHGNTRLKKPDDYKNVKGALSDLVGQLAMILGDNESCMSPKSKFEMIHDLDYYLKRYNDRHILGIRRYTDKTKTKEDIERTIKRRKEKIKDLQRNAKYHKEWHKERIEDLLEEINKLGVEKND